MSRPVDQVATAKALLGETADTVDIRLPADLPEMLFGCDSGGRSRNVAA